MRQANVPSSASYTLMLVDPDAPTPEDPKFAFWRHWVLPGLQPLAGVDGVVAQTKPAVTDYLGPGPKDSYVRLLILPHSASSRECAAGRRTLDGRGRSSAGEPSG